MLQIREVSKRFGGVVANDAVSINVARASIAGLIGPNGSGKTTLFNSIVGQHAIDGGCVYFAGQDLAGLSPPEIARLGLVRTYQHAHVFEDLTCSENLLISVSHARERYRSMMRRPHAASARRAAELLDFVALGGKARVRARLLSYGERKLLEFSMALMGEPRMLLLDEPTAGVNPAMIDQLIDRIREAVRAFGITLMVIEHNMRVIMDLADEVHCLAHGKLLVSGPPSRIAADERVIDAYLGVR